MHEFLPPPIISLLLNKIVHMGALPPSILWLVRGRVVMGRVVRGRVVRRRVVRWRVVRGRVVRGRVVRRVVRREG